MVSDGLQLKVARLSVIVYTAVSLVVAAAFFATSAALGYSQVARYGGTVWVFMLSMIISMPTVTPMVKRRLGES